jgi:hypothetical protein
MPLPVRRRIAERSPSQSRFGTTTRRAAKRPSHDRVIGFSVEELTPTTETEKRTSAMALACDRQTLQMPTPQPTSDVHDGAPSLKRMIDQTKKGVQRSEIRYTRPLEA